MLYKRALCDVSSLLDAPVESDDNFPMVKTASGKVMIEPGSEKSRIIQAEIEKHPTALFFRSKAIKADEPNSNGDYFSEEVLKSCYKSFEGVPFFTNHDNQNIENARGKVIFAEWVPEEKSIYTISFVDREAFPHICRSIEEEYVNGVSMGCSVEYSICNICGNKAEKTEDYCTHIRNRKGRKFSGKVKDVRTGETKVFKDEPVFEYNYGVKFIELSAVVDPACSSCRIEGIITNDEYLEKVASLQNSLYMVKTAALCKQAGQEEIQQLNDTLATLEQIAIKLIQNRQQVEVEFASDLVNILSELQQFVDELVGAGYGNVQSVPGTMEEPALPEEGALGGAPMEGGGALGEAPVGGAPIGGTPAGLETTAVGEVSGAPGAPAVTAPQLPITSPAKPLAAMDTQKLMKVASIVNSLNEKLTTSGEKDMGKRRTIGEKESQRKRASEVLSNSWQEKQAFFEYMEKVPSMQDGKLRLSAKRRDDSAIIVAEHADGVFSKVWTYEDLTETEKEHIKDSPEEAAKQMLETFASSLNNTKEGDSIMTDINKKAGAQSVNEQPTVTQEAQLEQQRNLYHPREDAPRNEITQAQLESERKGEPEVITEAQLDENIKLHPRENEEAQVITEAQLRGNEGPSPRTDEEWNEVTQAQLDTNGNRVNEEQEVITEKQLDKTDAPWARAANRDASMFKSASEHMDAVVDALADTAIVTSCTPVEAARIAGSLVDSTKDRYELIEALLDDTKDSEQVDYSKRLAYWGSKTVKVAGTGSDEIAQAIVSKLRTVVADTTINPDVVIDALDVVSEGEAGVEAVSNSIDKKLEDAKEETVQASRKSELRSALVAEKSVEQRDDERQEVLKAVEEEENKETREAERAIWQKMMDKKGSKKPDTIIETSFDELGVKKEGAELNGPEFKSQIRTFARGALASQNIKLATITNVTISDDTVSIAVQTDGEDAQSVDIPLAGESVEETVVEGETPEGDIAGESLEQTLPGELDMGTGQETLASSNKKMKRTAQVPMGGGMAQTPGDVAGGSGAPDEGGLPGDPLEGPGVEALTTDEVVEDVSEDIPTAGEQQMPYSICPECGSSDVDVERDDDGDISGDCNNCGAKYEALIKKDVEFKIIRPTRSVGEEGTEEPEAPEVPALPVAAQTNIDNKTIIRIGKNQKQFGHVCPACGMTQCKTASDTDGHFEYNCPACGTEVEKDVMVDVNNPEKSILRVKWDVVPRTDCEGCKEAAVRLASVAKVAGMLKTASETAFPKANCLERMARRYGGNAVASFGPCKGKPLADCVCDQLEKLGFTKERHMVRLADAQIQKDPMDECIEDQTSKAKSKGIELDVKEAENICNCLKKKFASEEDDNIYLAAFAEDIASGKEKLVTAQDLSVINDMLEEDVVEPDMVEEDIDIADELPPLDEVEEDVEVIDEVEGADTVTVELPVEVAEEVAAAADEALAESEPEVEPEVIEEEVSEEIVEGEPEVGSAAEVEVAEEIGPEEEKEMAMAMQSHKLRRVGEQVIKLAATPKKVENIEKDVEAGVPRAKATMGNENAENIDVPMAKPSVPRANAEMGHEGADNINPPAGLPNVAVDSEYMGEEKQVQSDMPPINNEIKGTVIAKDEKVTKEAEGEKVTKEAEGEKVTKEAKQLKEVDTVEGDVEAGVPRAKATMGEEGADNIDVPMAKPSVPRANAEMGEEGADNINPKATGPDVPVDNAYMGEEKDVQKDMPGINDEILKQVKQKRDGQMERIANARRMKATEVAAKLLATSRITEGAYEDVIDALANFQIDKIAAIADNMYPKVTKTAARIDDNARTASHEVPAIVLESKAQDTEEDMVSRISSQFTVGNRAFDSKLSEAGEK